MESFETDSVCPYYHQAVELIGRRWTGAILLSLYSGHVRFTDIAATVPGLSDRLLSERLKELEHEGMVVREVFPETPVRIEYHLTEKGRDLGDVMEAVGGWAHRWLAPAGGTENGDPESRATISLKETSLDQAIR